MPVTDEPTVHAGRGQWGRAFIIVTAAFFSGVVAGGAGVAVVFFHGFPPHGGPMMDPSMVMDYLRDELKLPPEKEAAVRAILRKHHAEFMAIHRETMPRIQSMFDQERDEVAALLSPEQAQRWREQFNTSKRRSMPIRHMLWLADTNDDGLVSKEELIQGFPGIRPEWFDKADTNKDGMLDKTEIQHAPEDSDLDGFGPP